MSYTDQQSPSKALNTASVCLLLVAGLLWLSIVASAAELETQQSDTGALEREDVARESLMSDVRAYAQRIQEMESSDGAFAPGLTEDLLGLGLALQRNGDHEQAVKVFKRGIHLSRINEGLYSRRQLSLLQGEIASHIAMGALSEADERQRYLYRVQAKTLSDVTRGQALMQHALWQRQAYEAGIGEDPFARLVNMWSLYRYALSEFAKIDGETSPTLLPPLYGMLRAQYLLSGFVGETTNGRFRTGGIYGDEESRQIAYASQSYKQGSSVIRAIYDIETAQNDGTLEDSAEMLLMLGDWQFWHGKRNEALETYGELYGELAEGEAAQQLRGELLGSPQPLPGLMGVRALPEPVDEQGGRLLLEFGVSDRGRVVNVVRLDDNVENDMKAGDVISRLKRTPFRPRIDDGLPVDTEGLRWAYDISVW
ncbi:hypothetical protein R0137_16635 [Congregibacter brevis]|uniref:TonB C-terminal domain-containing protein n=1 Tax=Congregibacter brevis TaxID=3081201 RepID=A0ABZ0IBS9_9GAMM|nr:hypothetical protein R0137_16635 [Congregibacter sp. IMCC45268]